MTAKNITKFKLIHTSQRCETSKIGLVVLDKKIKCFNYDSKTYISIDNHRQPSTTIDNHWQPLTTIDNNRQPSTTMVVNSCQWLLMVVDGCWWLSMVVDGCWWLLMVVDGCWWLSMVSRISYRVTSPLQYHKRVYNRVTIPLTISEESLL